MLELALSCEGQPDALGAWFPEHHLGVLVPRASLPVDEVQLARDLAPRRCFAGTVLRSYQEPSLAAGAPGETYRLLWVPSFSSPTVVRVEVAADGTARATVKRDRAGGAGLSASFDTRTLELRPAALARLRTLTQEAGCWKGTHTCQATFTGDPGRGLLMLDGPECVLEGARPGAHWGVLVRTAFLRPGAGGPFEALCTALREVGEVPHD